MRIYSDDLKKVSSTRAVILAKAGVQSLEQNAGFKKPGFRLSPE